MTNTALTFLALALTAGLAQAQLAHAQTADAGATRAAHEAGGPPGTIGAMAVASYGIATSPQDVVLQQRGMTTMAQGARPIAGLTVGRSAAVVPGTVGDAPVTAPGE